MAPKNRDPRAYIKPVALPIPSHQGMHIQARSETVYNCSNPTREAVFRENYARRRRQLTEQGYNAVIYRQYQCVGDKFFLNEKKMILHALGQLNNPDDVDDKSSSEDEDKDKEKEQKSREQQEDEENQAQPFVLRRKSTKNKKTLSKEVAEGRRMITSVKLGHGLFSIIRTQDHARRNAQEIEQSRLMEKRRREWQPAHIPSSSEDETDDELSEEVDLRTNTLNEEGTNATDVTTDDDTPRYDSLSPSKSILTELSSFSLKKKKKKKKVDPPRPYTPCHSNINIHPDTEIREDPSKDSIFRQLCAVNWILEAMNVEPPTAMGPILQSWNIKYNDLENNIFNKTTVKKVTRDKNIDVAWKGFLTHKKGDYLDRTKKILRNFGSTLTSTPAFQGSLRSTPRKNSFANALSLIQRSPSTLSSNQSSTPTPVIPDNYQDREDAMSRVDEDAEFEKWPSDAASNVINESVDEAQIVRRQRTGSVSSMRSTKEALAIAALKKDARQTNKPLLSQQELETRGPPSRKSDRAISTWVRSTSRMQLRSQSTPPDLKDPKYFPSKKHGTLAIDLRHKFNDVTEDKSLVLHDELEVLEKKRRQRSEDKFKAITHKKHISEQLEVIKEAARDPDEITEEKKRRKKQDEEIRWFQDLKNNLPPGFISDRRIAAIMEKLESIGNIESRKITPQKFLNVLSGLRSWELCSPDISAAVEFVRERVVNMAVDDFEEWCQHHMPNILRAQSAPPR
ncbi:coiled-coil domain-containing protein 60-like isoform X2 [Ptychodera flava]|uniref:coiled-coil domain-containing protein 60-like isoform X2 n=1 Tax=Ptychodera flava TaxID=63121 RepID=UPI003969F3D3